MSRLIYILRVFLVTLFYYSTIQAYQEQPLRAPHQATLSLHIPIFHFIKNNEYFGPLIKGHTLAGYALHPHLSYHLSTHTRTKLGIFARRYWAEKNFLSTFLPTLAFQYQYQHVKFLIGTMERPPSHRLIAPLYDTERILTDLPETGLQLPYLGHSTTMEIWLNWLTLLDKPNNIPEEILTGLSVEQILLQNSFINLKIPLQLLLYHLGGQGITIPDFSLGVASLGTCLTLHLSTHKFLTRLCLDNYYVANHYIKNVTRPFKAGHGFLSQITLHTRWFTLQGSYWKGYGFSSENIGLPLYQSICMNNRQVTYQEKHRELVLLHIKFSYQMTHDLQIILQIDPYYDLSHHLLEHTASLYITYQPCFHWMAGGN